MKLFEERRGTCRKTLAGDSLFDVVQMVVAVKTAYKQTTVSRGNVVNHQDHTMQNFIQWSTIVILCIPGQTYIVLISIVLQEHIFDK
jgi:hypothetical protein